MPADECPTRATPSRGAIPPPALAVAGLLAKGLAAVLPALFGVSAAAWFASQLHIRRTRGRRPETDTRPPDRRRPRTYGRRPLYHLRASPLRLRPDREVQRRQAEGRALAALHDGMNEVAAKSVRNSCPDTIPDALDAAC
jgi:hypothetical protein